MRKIAWKNHESSAGSRSVKRPAAYVRMLTAFVSTSKHQHTVVKNAPFRALLTLYGDFTHTPALQQHHLLSRYRANAGAVGLDSIG